MTITAGGDGISVSGSLTGASKATTVNVDSAPEGGMGGGHR